MQCPDRCKKAVQAQATICKTKSAETGVFGRASKSDMGQRYYILQGQKLLGLSLYHSGSILPQGLLMCDKEVIEVQKILPFLSGAWPLCRIGRAVILASQSCRQSCNKSQCPVCGCRSRHSCTHARRFSQSSPARGWGSIPQRQGAFGRYP